MSVDPDPSACYPKSRVGLTRAINTVFGYAAACSFKIPNGLARAHGFYGVTKRMVTQGNSIDDAIDPASLRMVYQLLTFAQLSPLSCTISRYRVRTLSSEALTACTGVRQ